MKWYVLWSPSRRLFLRQVKKQRHSNTESNECSRRMAEETDKFLQDSKISFKGSRSRILQ